MVAIVSGNSLGLSLTSKSTLGQSGNLGAADKGRSGEQSYVNMATGNFVLQRRDDYLVSTGEDVSSLRTYNSQGALSSGGWSFGVQRKKLEVFTGAGMGNYLMRTDEDGAMARYDFNGATGTYLSTAGAGSYDSLQQQADGSWSWTDGDTGLQEIYGGTGQLTRVIDPNGNAVDYSYSNGLISVVKNASGESTYYDYANGNISQIRVVRGDGQTTSRVSYGYDAANRLSQVLVDLTPEDLATVGGGTYGTSYTYDGASNRIASVSQQDGTKLSLTYVQVNSDWRVATVTDSLNQITQYAYDIASRRTTVTDPSGKSSSYSYDVQGQLTNVRIGVEYSGATWIGQTTVSYNERGDIVSLTDGTSNTTSFSYDSHGNQTRKEDNLGNTVVSTYDSRNQLLTQTVSGRDRQELTTRNIYDAAGRNKLRFSVSPQGRVVEYRYNAQGQKISTIQYGAAAMDIAALAATAVPSEAQMVNWIAGQDKKQTLRVDTSYDFRGQVSATTTYQGVDSLGNGLLGATTQYVYSQAGELLKTIQPLTGTVARYTYDGLGRVTTATMPSSDGTSVNTTSTAYDDAGGQITTTNATGLSTTLAYDRGGRLVSSTSYAAGGTSSDSSRQVESYAYDSAGRLVMAQDATGARRWIVYDVAGRKVADIDRAGAVTEYLLDGAGIVIGTVAYAQPLVVTSPPSHNQISTLTSTADRRTRNLYDSGGLMAYSVAANGAVTKFEYDSASRLVKTITYAQAIDPARIPTLTISTFVPPTATAQDRITRNYYDADGLLRASIDAENGVTEMRYDAAGRQTDKIRYQLTNDAQSYSLLPFVNSRPVAPALTDQMVSVGTALQYTVPDFKDPDSTDLLTYSALQANGAKLPAWLQFNPATRTFTGTPSFGEGGVVTKVNVTATDASGANAVRTFSIETSRPANTIAQGRYVYIRKNDGVFGYLQIAELIVKDSQGINISLNKSTLSSGDFDNGFFSSRKAVDGDTNSANGTFNSSGGEGPWFQLDLGTVQNIGSIQVYGRTEADALSANGKYSVYVGLSSMAGQTTTALDSSTGVGRFRENSASTITSVSAMQYPVPAPAITQARYVYIRKNENADGYLSFGEVVVRDTQGNNLAKGRTVTSSGAYSTAFAATYAVDGNTDPNGGSFSSNTVQNAWFEIDLGAMFDISGIEVLGRTDQYGVESNGQFTVYTGSASMGGLTPSRLSQIVGVGRFNQDAKPINTVIEKLSFSEPAPIIAQGRFIYIRKNEGVNNYLSFGEIQIFDAAGNNISRGAAVTNSLASSGAAFKGANVVDGKRDANVFASSDAQNGWLQVDLGTIQNISRIEIFGRTDVYGVSSNGEYTVYVGASSMSSKTPSQLELISGISRFRENSKSVNTFIDVLALNQAGATLSSANLLKRSLPWAPTPGSNDLRDRILYNARGQKTAEIDALGYMTEFVYDDNGNQTRRIRYATALTATTVAGINGGSDLATLRPAASAQDQVTIRTYDALNRVVSETDWQATVTSYKYDAGGRLAQTAKAAGFAEVRTLVARYDVRGHLIGELSAEGAALLTGNQTQTQIDAIWAQYGLLHTYDAVGRRISTTDQNNFKTVFYYDLEGRLTTTVNALGEISRNVYDAFGQKTKAIGLAQRVIATNLTGGLQDGTFTAKLDALADPVADTLVAFTYNVDGTVASTTKGINASNATADVTTFTYDAFGREIGRVETFGGGRSVARSSTYDRRGLLTETVNDVGNLAIYTGAEYDAFGRTRRTEDANGNWTSYEYDGLGRVVATTDPLKIRQTSTYDAFDRVVTRTDGLLQTTKYTYDTSARSVAVTTPEGITVTTSRNRFGQIVSVRDGNNNVTNYEYDRNGQAVSTATSLGRQSNSYDRAGRLVDTVDANGTVVHMDYDAANRVLRRVVDPAGMNLVTSYAYNARGQRVTVTDPNGGTTRFDYNANGDLVRQVVDVDRQADGYVGLKLTTLYKYDGRGKTLSVTDPNGIATTYTYDNLGRRVLEVRDPSTADHAGLNLSTRYLYDAASNLVAVTDPLEHLTRYGYDAGNRLRFVINAAGDFSETAYDAEGRVTRVTKFAARVKNTAVDSLDAETSATQWASLLKNIARSPSDSVENRVYDRDGRLTFTIDGSGSVVKRVYDRNGNVIERREFVNKVSGWVSGIPAPVEDPTDRISRTLYDAANRARFTVDALGGVVTQRYDANGNVTERIAYANRLDIATQPIPANATDGEMQLRLAYIANSQQDAHTRYRYDAAGRLSLSANGAGAVTAYSYDRNGNLLQQRVYSTSMGDYYWNDEGITGYVSTTAGEGRHGIFRTGSDGTSGALIGYVNDVASANTTPLYLLRNADGAYLYTADPKDVGAARALGWTMSGDGIVGHIDKSPAAGNTAMYRLNRTNSTAHFYSTSKGEIDFALLPGPMTPSSGDRVVRHVFDGANREILSIDSEGFATEMRHDATGNITQTYGFAKALSAANLDALDNAQRLRPGLGHAAIATYLTPGAADRATRHVFDAARREILTIDAEGAVSATVYDGLGQPTAVKRYATVLANAAVMQIDDAIKASGQAQPSAVTALLSSDPKNDRITRRYYDESGNLIYSRDAFGNLQGFKYDGVGRKLSATTYAASRLEDFWTDEGITGYVSKEPAPGKAALYHLSIDRGANSDWMFTTSASERDALVASGWLEEDVTGYIGTTKTADSVPLFRLAYPGTTFHYFTADPGLRDYALQQGWIVESTIGYVDRAPAVGNAPMFQLNQTGQKQHFYATNGRQVDLAKLPSFVANADDQTESFTYDSAGRVVTHTDAGLKTETFFYDGTGKKNSYINQKGSQWFYSYDASGNLTREVSPTVQLTGLYTPANTADAPLAIEPASATFAGVVTQMAYDAQGRLTSRTEGAGRPEQRTTRYEYDALGRQVKTVFPDVRVYLAESPLQLYANGREGSAARSETVVSLSSETRYDVFGNAVANRNTAGDWSYKAYDAAGRLAFDVDALGYVTGYIRDAWGNATSLTRSAEKSSLPVGGANAFSRSAVLQATAANDHSRDRDILTTYDRLGRTVMVQQPQADHYDSSSSAARIQARATVRQNYNAFGDVVRIDTLKNSGTGEWNITHHFYDKRGSQIATVDAEGYLTSRQYDVFGRLFRSTESAVRLSPPAWTVIVNPAAAIRLDAPTAASNEKDRSVRYTYDRLNRKTSETREHVQVMDLDANQNTIQKDADLTTSYGYDAVGNLVFTTDAMGATSYSYYDAMGRVTSVVGPRHSIVGKGGAAATTGSAVTDFIRDAYGNALVAIQRATATGRADALSFDTVGDNEDDRVTFTRFDAHGHAATMTDAAGKNINMSYDAAGRLAKQWRTVTDLDGKQQTLYTAYAYDKLGRQTHIFAPFKGGALDTEGLSKTARNISDTELSYNAFGELTTRSIRQDGYAMEGVEYYDYDNAGRVWRSNAGGGVDKVRLFDLQGNQTVEIVASGGNEELTGERSTALKPRGSGVRDWTGAFEVLSAVEASGANFRRTDKVYDRLGHLVDTIAPGRQSGIQQPVAVGSDNFLSAEIVSSSDQLSTFANSIKVNWSPLKNLGSGDVRIKLTYRSKAISQSDGQDPPRVTVTPGVVSDRFAYLTAEEALKAETDSGYNLQWQDDKETNSPRGADAILSVVVSKKDVFGVWQLVYTSMPGAAPSAGNDNSISSKVVDSARLYGGMTNRLELTWSTLKNPEGADVRIDLSYLTKGISWGVGNPVTPSVQRDRVFYPNAAEAMSGYILHWQDDAKTETDPVGIEKVLAVTVSKKDASGVWKQIYAISPGGAPSGTAVAKGNWKQSTTIDVGMPADLVSDTIVEYRPRAADGASPAAWTAVRNSDASNPVQVAYGSSYRFNLRELQNASGTYEYRIRTIARDGVEKFVGSGTLSAGLTTQSAGASPGIPKLPRIDSSVGTTLDIIDNQLHQVLRWQTPPAGTEVALRRRRVGATDWLGPVQELFKPADGRSDTPTGFQEAAIDVDGSGEFEYELTFKYPATETKGAYTAHAVGKYTVTAVPPSVSADTTPSSLPKIASVGNDAVLVDGSVYNIIKWPQPPAGTFVQIRFIDKNGVATWRSQNYGIYNGGTASNIGLPQGWQGAPLNFGSGDYDYQLFFLDSAGQPASSTVGKISIPPKIDAFNKTAVAGASSFGWVDEGIIGYIYTQMPYAGKPLMRWAANSNSAHFFIADDSQQMTNYLSNNGWRPEGIAGYVNANYPGAFDSMLYRLWQPNTNIHYYTTDLSRVQQLVANGWTREADQGYISRLPVAGTKPLYQMYLGVNGDRLYTAEKYEHDYYLSATPNDPNSPTVTSRTEIFQGMKTAIAKIDNRSYNVLEWVEPPGARVRVYDANGNEVTNQPAATNRVFANGGGRATLDNGFAKAVIVDAVGTSYYRFLVEYPASDPGGLRVAEAMVRVEVPAGGGSTSAVAFTDTTPPYAAKIANVRIGADNIDGTLHQTLLWQKPPAGATTSLKMRLAGATQWLQPQPGIYSLGDNRSSPPADAQEGPIGIYGPGDYEYELVITAADGTLSKATGRFTIFAKTSSTHTDTTALYLGNGPNYDAGLPAGSVRPRVHQTVDRWGNVLEANDPRLAWETGAWRTKYEYNDSNQLIKQSRPQDTNEGDAVTEIYYDKLGRQTGVKDARKLFVNDVEKEIVNKDFYDAAGQLVAKRFADGGQQDFGYNVFGDKVSSAELFQAGRTVVTNFGYDKLARLTTSSLAGVTSAWKYTVGTGFNPDVNGGTGDNDAADNVSKERGEQRTIETIRYDEAGRKLRVITGDDDARVVGNADKRLDGTTLLYTRYDYDLAGNIVRTGTEDRAGNLIVFPAVSQFDSLGRKITQTTQRINGSATEAWRYDIFGKLVAQSTYRLDPANSAYKGSVNITYRYNNAGELVHKDSTAGQNIDYAYDGAGQLTGIVDRHLGQTSTYAYDLAGNRLIEQVKQQTVLAGGGIAEVVYQDNHLAYDSQSRLRQVANGQTKVFIDYDKAGNRTRVQTQVSNVLYDAATGTRTEKWEQKDVNTFGYDAMNRQTSGDNVDYRYDLAGNRIFEDRHDGRATTFAYDDLHRIWEGRQNGTVVFEQRYDQAGRVVYSKSQVNVYNMPNRWAPEYRYNVYGSDGRLADTRVVLRNGSGPFNLIQSDDIHYHFYDASVRGNLGYDAAGNLRGYAVETYVMPDNANHIAEEHRRVITSYQYDHIGDRDVQVKADTLLEQLNRRDMGIKQDVRSKQDTSYDANGFMSNKQQTDPKLNRTFVNDSAGRALYINEGAGTQGDVGRVANGTTYLGGSTGNVAEPGHVMRQLVVNGEVLGRYGDAAVPSTTRKYDSLAEFNLQAPAINTGPGGSDAIQYTVSGQESLRSIAASVLGDANLWFRIAEANGLAASDSAKLESGTTLRIPRITLNANRVDTFTPYDPAKAVGGSDPALPNLPAPQGKGGGCGGFGQIIMVAVAVAATIYTAGALSAALYGVPGSVFQAGVGVLSAGTAGTAGAITAVGGVGSLGAIGIAAGGAAVGSIASQAAGNLLGVQSGFSWNQVALSAVAGGVGAGLQGSAAGGASQLSDAARFGNAVGNAALGNAITQGIGIATGFQRSFDWKGVAASAVGGGVAQATSGAFRTAFGDFGGRVATSLVSGTAAAVMRGGRVAVQQVAADAFGNAVGISLVNASSSVLTQGQGAWSEPDYRNGSDIQSDNAYMQKQRDAMYGFSTRPDPFSLKGDSGVGLSYAGLRAAPLVADDTRVLSDSRDPYEFVPVGQTGRPTAQMIVPPALVGAGGIAGGGYQVVRPLGAGTPPPYDLRADRPNVVPGYALPDIKLGAGTPPLISGAFGLMSLAADGFARPAQSLVDALNNLVFKSNSEKLADNLRLDGYTRPNNTDAHHIVPVKAGDLRNVRDQLQGFGIGINDASNGVFLPGVAGSEAEGAYHRSLHNKDYFNQLQRDFEGVSSKSDALDVLDRIRDQLLKGTYPGSKPTPPKP